MKRTTARGTMTRRAAVGGIGLMALSGCGLLSNGSDEDEREDQDTPEEDTQDEGEEDTSDDSSEEDTSDTETEEDSEPEEETTEEETEDDTDTGASGGSPTEVDIDASFSDEELGDEFHVISALRNAASTLYEYDIENGSEVFYVQFEMSPTGEWGGSISPSDFTLVGGGSAELSLNSEMSEAGYTPLDLHSRQDGDLSPVWIAFVTTGGRQTTYDITYTRPESEVIGEDRTLPEFTHTFTVPAP